MAKAITPEQIKKIHELYALYGVKARVAKELGISASTVSKYLAAEVAPPEPEVAPIPFDGDVPVSISPLFSQVLNWGELVELSAEECAGITELQKEVSI